MSLIPIRVSVLGQTLAFALLVGALAFTPASRVDAQKGKPPSVPDATATVTLANRAGDGLTSVGAADYLGAQVLGGSGDLRLELGTSGRAIQVSLGERLTIGAGVEDAPPSGATYLTDAVLFIDSIRGVPVGSTQTRVGRIGLGTAYPNHALGFRVTTSSGVAIYGTDVCVTRVSLSVWDVASSCVAEPSDTAGLFEENLKGKINQRFKANYTLPFSFRVTCTANCPQ